MHYILIENPVFGLAICVFTPSFIVRRLGKLLVDLSNAVLEHSSFEMYANMPASVEEIVLPKLSKDGYDVQGKWYTADGTWNPSKYYDKGKGTRISANQSGQTIYRNNPKA